jgi:hypothetical protein
MVAEIELFESDLCTEVAKYAEVGSGIFEHLIWTVTILSRLYQICHLTLRSK